MQGTRATTIAEYIQRAPDAGQALLRELYTLLRQAAPDAQEAIKWGNPFFVEPRFLFAFSAHKAHLSFAPGADAMAAFREELSQHRTTKHFLQVPYTQPLPAGLIRRMAEYRVKALSERDDDGFW